MAPGFLEAKGKMSRVKNLLKLGQSPWYDNIERGLLLSGKLNQMIEEDGLRGVTSNPTIFEKAISGSPHYRTDIERFKKEGKDAASVYDELVIADIKKAADILLEVYHSSHRVDGYVSVEVSPHLAFDIPATINEAKRLWEKIARPNLMIKVPAMLGAANGSEAIGRLTAEGINVNATLIFSQTHYITVAEAYIKGIEERIEKGLPVEQVHAVASFFISRLDTYIDKLLNDLLLKERDEKRLKQIEHLIGKAAVAQAKVIYNQYQNLFYGLDFMRLKNKNANVQRLLFGSTGTKNPYYSDVKYVEEVIGEGTINTMPQATLDAFRDHGVAALTLNQGLNEARTTLSELENCGIAMEAICQNIQDDGLQAFIESYDKLIATLNIPLLNQT